MCTRRGVQAIAFVGGTIPLIGWHLEGGILTGVLWAFSDSGFISWSARLVLQFTARGDWESYPDDRLDNRCTGPGNGFIEY